MKLIAIFIIDTYPIPLCVFNEALYTSLTHDIKFEYKATKSRDNMLAKIQVLKWCDANGVLPVWRNGE